VSSSTGEQTRLSRPHPQILAVGKPSQVLAPYLARFLRPYSSHTWILGPILLDDKVFKLHGSRCPKLGGRGAEKAPALLRNSSLLPGDRLTMQTIRVHSVVLSGLLLLAGCATVAGVKFTPPAQKSWADVQKDSTECETSVASYSTAVGEGVKEGVKVGALSGLEMGLWGAATGALEGATSDIFGMGAAGGSWMGAAAGVFVGLVVGAVTGAVTGVKKANEERQPYVEAYKRCLRDRGYSIAGETNDAAQQPASDLAAPTPEEPPAKEACQ